MTFRFPLTHGLSPPFTSYYSRNHQTVKGRLRPAREGCYPSHEAKASGISAHSFKLGQFAKDKETGRILEYEVIDDLTADKLREQAIFDLYKNHLLKECGQHGQIRFNVIEYVCQFAKIDPIEIAVALRKDGRVIAFDDSSISRGENVRKRKMVEMAFAEAMNEGSVDDLILKAEKKKKEPVMNGVGRDLGER